MPRPAAQGGNQPSERERDAGDVVGDGPGEVLANDAHRPARDQARLGDVGERAGQEDEVGMRARLRRAVADRERRVGARHHGSVVEAVTDHRDAMACGLQRGDRVELVGGRRVAPRIRHAEPARDVGDPRAASPESSWISSPPSRSCAERPRARRRAAPRRSRSGPGRRRARRARSPDRRRSARDRAAGRPRRRAEPVLGAVAADPSTPRPGYSRTCRNESGGGPESLSAMRARAGASRAMRARRRWRARAPRRGRERERPAAARRRRPPGSASVSVPVLSKQTVSMPASDSSASKRCTRTPRRTSAPAAASSADGAASDNAHGQVTISTETATQTARDGSMNDHAAPASAARTSTPQRNGPATRSAALSTGGRSVIAVRIRRTIPS